MPGRIERCRNEFIHLLFASLDIPVLHISSEAERSKEELPAEVPASSARLEPALARTPVHQGPALRRRGSEEAAQVRLRDLLFLASVATPQAVLYLALGFHPLPPILQHPSID